MTIVLLFRRYRTTLLWQFEKLYRLPMSKSCGRLRVLCYRGEMLAPVLTYRDCTGTDWQEGVWITNLTLEVISGLLLVVYLWLSAGEATELAGLTRKATLLEVHVGRYLKRKAARKASLMKAQILQFWGPQLQCFTSYNAEGG